MATYTINFSGSGNTGAQIGGIFGGTQKFIVNKPNDTYLKNLQSTNPHHDKQRIRETKGGLLLEASNWILSHDDFRRWRDNNDTRLLWIKGDPGKGKTMLLMTIVDELEQELEQDLNDSKQQEPRVLSYFFCQGTDEKLNNATAILKGLIYLLATKHQQLASHLRQIHDTNGPEHFNGQNSFYALREVLEKMLQDKSLEKMYLVVDALDECMTDQKQLLETIIHFIKESPNVKWLVSSRNRPEIEEYLEIDDSRVKLGLEITQNAEQVSCAVRTYINYSVSQIKSLREDEGLQHRVRDTLHKRAGDTFLWAALVIEKIAKAKVWNVQKVLENMPRGLEELYGHMMNQIQELEMDDPKFCQLVLSAVTLAYRPLHMLELSVLSGIPENISSEVEYVQELVTMCGSFLTIRKDKVYIIHQSARDYLRDKASTTIFPSGAKVAHHGMFLRSLDKMRNSLRRDMYNLQDLGSSTDNLKIPDTDPLASLRYSCMHWVDHLLDAQYPEDLTDGGNVHKFLKGSFLYWIEALSLVKRIPDGISALEKLKKALEENSNNGDQSFSSLSQTTSTKFSLLSLTLDAYRFLFEHGLTIKNFPLQTYASVLLFTPSDSLTRGLFWKEEPQWILTKPVVSKLWGSHLKTLEGHNNWVNSIAFSPDGKLIASASLDETIKVWDVATGEARKTLEGHRHSVNSIAFSPDGKLIASASSDETIKVWDVATGEARKTLEGHRHSVNSIAFSPDGKLIASASWDKTIKVWDVATGEARKTLEIGVTVDTLSFDTTGLYLLTEIGRIPLDAASHNNTQIPTEALSSSQQEHRYGLSADKSWITWNGSNLLFLPYDYRPSRSAVWCATAPSTIMAIAIGSASGRVIILRFSRSPFI